MADLNSNLDLWLASHSPPEWVPFIKRLSANDTGATGSHQAGLYLPNPFVFDLFPSLQNSTTPNPRTPLPFSLTPVDELADVNVIWYNNRLTGGTRDECRITGFGGSASPLQDPANTGSLLVLFFRGERSAATPAVAGWLCASEQEELVIEDRFGPVEPGRGTAPLTPGTASLPRAARADCTLRGVDAPIAWSHSFPQPDDLVTAVVKAMPLAGLPPDSRLLKRRDCEFRLFRELEDRHLLPEIREGFASVGTFVNLAHSVTNRRKARAGRSLELHLQHIFKETGVRFDYNQVSEGAKKPDFLFPSAAAYQDPRTPPEELRMLGAKTSCKDRWRQVINEADRIPTKHLLTLQEGVSESQFEEMQGAGVILVVPEPLKRKYPRSVQPHLMSLESFSQELLLIQQ